MNGLSCHQVNHLISIQFYNGLSSKCKIVIPCVNLFWHLSNASHHFSLRINFFWKKGHWLRSYKRNLLMIKVLRMGAFAVWKQAKRRKMGAIILRMKVCVSRYITIILFDCKLDNLFVKIQFFQFQNNFKRIHFLPPCCSLYLKISQMCDFVKFE